MIQCPVGTILVSVSADVIAAGPYPCGALLPSTIAVFAESSSEHAVTQHNGLKSFSDLCAVNLTGDADSDTLIESAGSLVSVGSMLEVQILNGRKREVSAGGRARASNLLLRSE
jgi:hypothetical protein